MTPNQTGRLSYEGHVVLLASWRRCPDRRARCCLLWTGGHSPRTIATLTTVIVVGLARVRAGGARARGVSAADAIQPARRVARGRFFGARPVSPRPDDALGEVMREVNTLGSTLREQRLGAMEATMLLRTVMREIDVAIFAFDENQRLRLVNRAGERLLDERPENLLGQTADELQHRIDCLDGPDADHAASCLSRAAPGVSACAEREFASAACPWN